MKKFLKYTVVSIFLIAFLIVTAELGLMYKRFPDHIFNPQYFVKEDFCTIELHQSPTKKSIILMGCSFFLDNNNETKFVLHSLLSKQTKRNVYNLAIKGSSVPEILYILRSYNKNIELKKLINNDTNIEHVIINYLPWHVKSIFISNRGLSPHFKKDNNELLLDKNPVYNMEIVYFLNSLIKKFSSYKILPIFFNTYILYAKEIKKEIEKQFGKDVKLSILVVKEFGFENWDELKSEGINIINLNEILGFDINTREYQISCTNNHPNEKAWEVILPALIKELSL